MHNVDKIINALFKTRNHIKQLCGTVNTLSKECGGNDRNVLEDDFFEPVTLIESLLEDTRLIDYFVAGRVFYFRMASI